jgi:hypothetical protein
VTGIAASPCCAASISDGLSVVESRASRLRNEHEPSASDARSSYFPVKIVEALRPIGVTSPAPGTYVVDFGQNFRGLAAPESGGRCRPEPSSAWLRRSRWRPTAPVSWTSRPSVPVDAGATCSTPIPADSG